MLIYNNGVRTRAARAKVSGPTRAAWVVSGYVVAAGVSLTLWGIAAYALTRGL